jgi:hypothetical protein
MVGENESGIAGAGQDKCHQNHDIKYDLSLPPHPPLPLSFKITEPHNRGFSIAILKTKASTISL